jgi:hypothetical protein
MISDVQAKDELLTWMRRAITYFDQAAERPVGSFPDVDPAQLYSEGKVCLLRLESERDRR